MSLLLVNVLLALVWTAVSGSFSFLNFAFGFVLAIFALSLIREQVGSVGYFSRRGG
jgi:multicomponent Na+:H+ antiporter subunit E